MNLLAPTRQEYPFGISLLAPEVLESLSRSLYYKLHHQIIQSYSDDDFQLTLAHGDRPKRSPEQDSLSATFQQKQA